MTAYVALLRGVNVGRNNRIAMADLRGLLTGLGHSDVATHLQSGNAIFASPAGRPERIAADIEAALARELGLRVRCLVRDHADLRRVVAGNPFADVATDPSRLLVTFLSARPAAAKLAALDPAAFAPERFAAGSGREVYVYFPHGMQNARLTYAFFERTLGGVVATGRNWNTVTALETRLGALTG